MSANFVFFLILVTIFFQNNFYNFISVLEIESQHLHFFITSAMRGNVSITSSLEKV